MERLKEISENKSKKCKKGKENISPNKQKTESGKCTKISKKRLEETDESETEEEEIHLDDEESDESLLEMANRMEEELDENEQFSRTISEVAEGDWILVKLSGKKTIKYYVGQVLVREPTADNDVQVKFARKSNFFTQKSVFKFPMVDDIGLVSLSDIIKLLPQPKICRRGEILFELSFAGYNVQ